LDEQGMAVQVMRSVTYVQAGEVASCVGCHEPRNTAPLCAAPPMALRRPPSKIEPGPDGSKPLSYPILVQPVLDKHCVKCHGAMNPSGGVVLTGAPQGHYTFSYNALAPKVSYSAWGRPGGDFRKVNSEPLSRPDYFGARGSPLLARLLKEPCRSGLTASDMERLVTWMDANALFYGTFDPADQARQQRGERIAGPKLQ
jgi:mono/diheme cytochrome c family protein